MKILVVEDDPTDLKLLIAVLDASGHQVLGQPSAEAALAEIRRQQPELIVLDLRLPGMDGLALARLLKADSATRTIPIVALTAAREIYDREDALAAGCDAYLVKPVNTRSFASQVTDVAARTR
ncbi:MAG: response regulator [Opitutae bacterium]|nr:response regulator [Opitutae bacterium]